MRLSLRVRLRVRLRRVHKAVKTEQNWLFNISALRLLSECSWPFSFKGETPFPS